MLYVAGQAYGSLKHVARCVEVQLGKLVDLSRLYVVDQPQGS